MKFRSLILFATLALALSACNFSLAEDITPPPNYKSPTPAPTLGAFFPASAPSLNAGQAIYAEKCAPCHGETGQGDGSQAANLPVKVPALGSPEVAAAAAPATWYNIVTQGKIETFMPPFASLSDQERWDVVAYAFSLSAPIEQVQIGRALYEVNCAQCHGADGKQLADSDLTSQELMAKFSRNDLAGLIQKGVPPAMPASDLADEDAAALAAYVRTFTFASSGADAARITPTPQPASAATDPTPSDTVATPEATLAAEATPATPQFTISGAVTNETGADLPADLKAVLHLFEHDFSTNQFSQAETVETVVKNNTYTFTDIALTENNAFYISIDFKGTIYESEAGFPTAGVTSYDLPITVYDTTTDKSDLVASKVHILLDYSQAGKIQVVEFFIISNAGSKTIVAAEAGGPIVEIALPQGYQNLQFEDGVLGERFQLTDSGFADTVYIKPGEQNYQIVFAFDMPYEKETSPLAVFSKQKFELTQPFAFKAESVSFLVPEGVTAEGQNFTNGGIQAMGSGVSFQLYEAGTISAGQTFTASASGEPKTANSVAQGTDATQNIIIGVGAFGVVLILAGGFLFWRDRRAAVEENDGDEDDVEDLSQDDILDAIIALDDQFKAGNLSEEAYKQRREQLKAKLK